MCPGSHLRAAAERAPPVARALRRSQPSPAPALRGLGDPQRTNERGGDLRLRFSLAAVRPRTFLHSTFCILHSKTLRPFSRICLTRARNWSASATVDQPVVVAQGKIAAFAGDDRIVAEVVGDDHRALFDRADAP